MTNIRLLPVVVLAISALLVLKTLGLVTEGGYVLAGVGVAQAAGGGGSPSTEAPADAGGALSIGEPTVEETSPTIADPAPTLPTAKPAAGHGGTDEERGAGDTHDGAAVPEGAAQATGPAISSAYCIDGDATLIEDATGALVQAETEGDDEGSNGDAESSDHEEAADADAQAFAEMMKVECLPNGDAVPLALNGGAVTQLIDTEGSSATEQQLLARLAARREELLQYEQDLAMRASLVDAAEQRIEERSLTLEALEAQIASLVDQRQEMEQGQFASIVAMYEAMKPKDAANIFNNLEMEVLLRVAKTMSPRKMAPILAEMSPARAQELTVKMAAIADLPPAQMTPDDLAELPQIVGQ